MKKIFPILLILVTVLYLTRGFFEPKEKQEAVDMTGAFQTPVRVVTVRGGSLQDELRFPLDVRAFSEVKVNPTYMGRIEKVLVKEGQSVKKGDKLLKYDGPQEGAEGFFDDLYVRAPIDGVVSVIYRESGMSGEKDMPLISLTALDPVKAVIDLPNEYITMLGTGMTIVFTVDAYSDKTFSGKLYARRPQVDSVSRTTQVEFLVVNKEHLLLPGMTGTVKIKSAKQSQGLLVPMESILVQNDQGYVYVYRDGKAIQKKITVLQEGVETAVIKGLVSGEQVLTIKPDTLKDGDPVYVVK
jgi:membrane fusion protein (multidrug efflux system)